MLMALALLNRDRMETNIEPLYLTISQAGELLKISPRTVQCMLQRQHLPGVKIGSQWRVSKIDLAKLIEDLEEL